MPRQARKESGTGIYHVMLRGINRQDIFEEAEDYMRMLNVERDRWHSLECLESGSVLYESKDGPYHPLEEDEIMVK